MGEASSKLTEDFRAEHAEIPWRQIKGLRNFIAHQYDAVLAEPIARVALYRIPELLGFLEGFALDLPE